jgi:hypothetical protein
MALREKDMSRDMAGRLRDVERVYRDKARAGEGAPAASDKVDSITGALLRAMDQLAVEVESVKCQLDELEERLQTVEEVSL